MDDKLLADLLALYVEMGCPGGYLEEEERNERGFKTALHDWKCNYDWYENVVWWALETLHPNRLGMPGNGPPDQHEIVQDIKAMQAENARLRAALQQIADTVYSPRSDAVTSYGIGYEHAVQALGAVARAALEGQS